LVGVIASVDVFVSVVLGVTIVEFTSVSVLPGVRVWVIAVGVLNLSTGPAIGLLPRQPSPAFYLPTLVGGQP